MTEPRHPSAADAPSASRSSLLAANEPVASVTMTTLQQVMLTAVYPTDFAVESGQCTVSALDPLQTMVCAGSVPGDSVIVATAHEPAMPKGHMPLVSRAVVHVVAPVMALTFSEPESQSS